MKAWNIDADNLKLENTIIDYPILVHNKIINNYLNIGLHDNKFFIVAPKGFGKTLLLKIKSQKYRQNTSYTCIPKTRLCERMVDSVSYFNTQELNKFEDDELWKDLWSLCINIMILKNVEKDSKLPNSIIDIVGNADSLSDILRLVLSNRKKLNSLVEINAKFLNPKVKRINKSVAIFIDNIDEALDNHVGSKLKNSIEIGKTTKSLSHKVWINAQLGIIKTILNTYISNRHIKIFTSIRLEAFISNDAPTGMQINDYTSILEYNKEELEEIFIKNIEYTEKSDIYNSEETDHYLKFLGITEIEHTSITDINGHTVTEPIFDYILRHTFRRPREIVLMGRRLSKMKKNGSFSNKELKEEIREKVNEVSVTEILEQYQNEIIPHFNRDYFNLFCANVKKNILNQNDLAEIDQKVFQAGQIKGFKELKNISNAFYHMGLIGYAEEFTVKGVLSDKYEQKFLPIARYLKKDKDFPTAPRYFFIHPSLNHRICQHVDPSDFYDRNNIVGYNYPFNAILPSDILLKNLTSFFNEEEYEKCVSSFKANFNNSSTDKNTDDIYSILIRSYIKLGKLTEAQQSLQKGISLKMESVKALPLLNDLLKLNPQNPDLLNLKGKLLIEQENVDDAQVLFNEADKIEADKFFEENLRSDIVLKEFQVQNYLIFENLEWHLEPQMNIILGKNGYGKTELLKILLQTLLGEKKTIDSHHINYSDMSCSLLVLKNNELEKASLESNSVFKTRFGKVPTLGITDVRIVDRIENINFNSGTSKDLLKDGAYYLLNDLPENERIKDLFFKIGVEYLDKKDFSKMPIIGLVEKVMKELTGSSFKFEDITSSKDYNNFTIKVTSELYSEKIPIQLISRGSLSVISIFGLICKYLESLHPDSSDPLKEKGIVIIDEIDAHLHPDWQYKIIDLLRKSFPNVQFVLSAHSPIVVAGCFKNEVSVLKLDSNKKRFYIEQFNKDFIGTKVTDIYSEVFNIPNTDQTFLKYQAFIPFENYLKDKLEKFKSNEPNNQVELNEIKRQLNFIEKYKSEKILK